MPCRPNGPSDRNRRLGLRNKTKERYVRFSPLLSESPGFLSGSVAGLLLGIVRFGRSMIGGAATHEPRISIETPHQHRLYLGCEGKFPLKLQRKRRDAARVREAAPSKHPAAQTPSCFDRRRYWERNLDVQDALIDPWHHYANHGNAEGREFPLAKDASHTLTKRLLGELPASLSVRGPRRHASTSEASSRSNVLGPRRAELHAYLMADVKPCGDGVLLLEHTTDYLSGLPTTLNLWDRFGDASGFALARGLLGVEPHLEIVCIRDVTRVDRVSVRDQLQLTDLGEWLRHPIRFHIATSEIEVLRLNELVLRDSALSLQTWLRARHHFPCPTGGGVLEVLQLLGIRLLEDQAPASAPEIWMIGEHDPPPASTLYEVGRTAAILRTAGPCCCPEAPRLCGAPVIRKPVRNHPYPSRTREFEVRCSNAVGHEMFPVVSASQIALFLEMF